MSEALPLNEVPEDRRPTSNHWIVLGLLVFVHAAFGSYFTPNGKAIDDGEVLSVLMLGFLGSQPILFAIWAAFAPQRFYHRFLWSFVLCSLVSFAVDLGSLRHTQSVLRIGMLFDIPVFIVVTIILLAFRRFSRWQIKQPNAADVPADYQASQFGIQHLIILTTITALTCGLFRTLLMVNPSMEQWSSSVALFIGVRVMIFVLVFPVLVIPWYTLAYRWKAVPTTIVLAVCDLPVLILITLFMVTGGRGDTIKPILLVQLGAGLSVFISTLIIRWSGFRMIRQAKT
jgi:hypothetical protein